MRPLKFKQYIKNSNNVFKKVQHLADKESINDYFLNADKVENIITCQFTGLKDSNGIEVYEGDILQVKKYLTKDSINFYDHIDFVRFDKQLYMFMFGDDYLYSLNNLEFYVIGNIYINPELVLENDIDIS